MLPPGSCSGQLLEGLRVKWRRGGKGRKKVIEPQRARAWSVLVCRQHAPRPSPKVSRAAVAALPAKKHCNCKNSRCLKLYCECFASGRYCDGCNCVNCCNNKESEQVRQAAVEAILERNPNAFRPKIQVLPSRTNRQLLSVRTPRRGIIY